MGVYDQLYQLDKPTPPKKSTVRPPDASKTVETAPTAQSPTYQASRSPEHRLAPHHTNRDEIDDQHPSPRPSDRATGQPGDPPAVASGVQKPAQPAGRAAGRPRGLSHRRPRHRRIVRHGFELYQDQIDLLRQISLEAKLTGDDLSMSAMVREALDEYVTHKNLQPNEGSG